MEKSRKDSEAYVTVTYRCEKCRNLFEGVVRKQTGAVRLDCSACGASVVLYI